MILSIIVAMTRQGVIGVNNSLPWHLPEDLKRFKRLTSGHPVIMGRKTFDSIGRPLPNRTNIVITRNAQLQIPGVTCVNSLEKALAPYQNSAEEVFVIGGSQIFAAALPRTDRLYATWVEKDVPGDIVFPSWSPEKFKTLHDELIEGGSLPYRFTDYIII